MDFGEIVSNAFKYPSTGLIKVLILGIIMIIPIVNFIGWGYLLRIMKATFTGFNELPDFDQVGDLFIDGLKILVIFLIAAVPVIIVYLIIIFSAIAATYNYIYLVIAIIFYAIMFLLLYPYLLMYAVRSITLLASNE